MLEAFEVGDMVAQKLALLIANCGSPSFQLYAACTLLTAEGEVATDTAASVWGRQPW